IARVLPKFWSVFGELKRAAMKRKPDVAILVDWPDFNSRLAHWLHRRGIKVIYYVSPQLWAWRSYRARALRRDVDLLLSILPFEKEWYDGRGMTHVEYVGHPLVGKVCAGCDREEFCRRHGLDPARPIVALLPGSRRKELIRILPPMLDAAILISRQRSGVQFVLVVAPNRDLSEAQEIVSGDSYDSLRDCLRVVHQET